MVIIASFVHWPGCLSGNGSAIIQQLTASWCCTLQTMLTHTVVDHGGFLIHAVKNWSCSSLRTPAVSYTINWRPFTSIWIYSHPTACCFIFLLLLILWRIFQCASWVILLLAALAVLRWTDSCLRSCCVPISNVFDVAPVNCLDSDLLSPGWGGCVTLIWWSGIGEEDDNKKKWEVLRTIQLASCQNGKRSSQHVRYTQDKSCCVWLQVAGVSHRPVICN